MQGELTSRLSSSWMYITYTPLLFDLCKKRKILFSVCTPLLMNWQKGGEKFGVFIYACLFYLLPFTIDIKIGIKSIFCWYQIFFCWYQEHLVLYLLIGIKSMFISLVYQISCLCIFYVEHLLHIFMFIAMHELRGSFYEA